MSHSSHSMSARHNMSRIRYMFALVALVLTGMPPAWAQNRILLEIRDLPGQCRQANYCIDRSTLAMRNLLSLAPSERNSLLQTINQISTVRGLPEDVGDRPTLAPENMTPALHPLPLADPAAPLIGHPGVYFDPSSLDSEEATSTFSAMIVSQLTAAGVRLLTREQMEATPGRPTLSVHFSPRRESAGCIIPYAFSMKITEEMVMVRNPALKLTGSIWSRTARQNLANLNYTPANALNEVISALITDWQAANS